MFKKFRVQSSELVVGSKKKAMNYELITNNSRGFTLIELLVVMTIIAVLSAIGLMTYSRTLKQGRDSKRESDLRSMQSALEQFYADQFFYPSNVDNSMDALLSSGGSLTNRTGNPALSSTRTYMNSVPQDPTGSNRYRYDAISTTPCDNVSSTTQCTSYCLYAKLEIAPSPIPTLPTGCTYPSGGYNFFVSPP